MRGGGVKGEVRGGGGKGEGFVPTQTSMYTHPPHIVFTCTL